MEDFKKNISENLIKLRKQNKLTQQDLAKIINYSDKAISRWEVGESLPDIVVLLNLCEYYGVPFEWLIKEHSENDQTPQKKKQETQKLSLKIIISCLIVISLYGIATVLYVYSLIIRDVSIWQIFIWAVPISVISLLLFGRKFWDNLTQLIMFSAGVWSLIASIYCQLLSNNLWALFLLGIPIQIILILTFIFKKIKD